MKKVIFLAFLGSLGFTAQAQDLSEKEVPSVVLNAFQQQFSSADDAEWEKEDNQYVVEFEIGKADHKAWLDPSGKILMHGQEVEDKALPAAVKAAIERDYKGYDVDEVVQINSANAASFAVELEKGKEELTVIYNKDGSKK